MACFPSPRGGGGRGGVSLAHCSQLTCVTHRRYSGRRNVGHAGKDHAMQNVHSHCFDAGRHLQPETLRESDLSRGYPLNLTTRVETFLEEMAPFEKVAVFGLKARRT